MSLAFMRGNVNRFFIAFFENGSYCSHLTAREGEMKTLIFGVPLTVVFLASILTISDVHPVKAQGGNTFVIAATSGYGVEDCLGEGGECGRVVADAWCEAHGQGAALKFGEENESGVLIAGRRPYFITCGE